MKKLWNRAKDDWRFWLGVLTFVASVAMASAHYIYDASAWVNDVTAVKNEVPAIKSDVSAMKGDIKTINQRVEDIWKAMRLDRLKK